MVKKKKSEAELQDRQAHLQDLILSTRISRMPASEAIQHINNRGFNITANIYFKTLKGIKNNTLKRTFEIAKNYSTYRLESIDKLKLIEQHYWDLINNPKTEIRDKITCMKHVTEMQPYLSAYRESVKYSAKDDPDFLAYQQSKIVDEEVTKKKKSTKKKRPPLADLLTLNKNEDVSNDTEYPPKQW